MSVTDDKVHLSLKLSRELHRTLEDIAQSTGRSGTDIMRQALALMLVAHQTKQEGRHIGIVSDASKLDTEFVDII